MKECLSFCILGTRARGSSLLVVVGVSFISRFTLQPLMGMHQEQSGMYLI